MIEIKTIASSNVAEFDEELQTCLNEGWVMVGQIRTVPFAENRWSENEKEIYCMHYVTLKRVHKYEMIKPVVQTPDAAKSKEIQRRIRTADLKQWQVAEKIGINESMFSRKMRDGITESEFEVFSEAIDEMCGGASD